MGNKPIRILVVGQTPPPFGGQAIMIENLLKGEYRNAKLFHVRMSFSHDMDEVGRFSIVKALKLISMISRIIYMRVRFDVRVLYYPPAGPNLIPMYRDLVVLITTRWLFRATIFHFHAGGLSELYPRLGPLCRLLFRWAYFNPDVAIRLSELTPQDGEALWAKKEYIIPYGVQDHYQQFQMTGPAQSSSPVILYVGVLKESKGVLVLIDACSMLAARGFDFRVNLVGKFESPRFEATVKRRIAELGLGPHVNFLGVRTGEAKYKVFAEADIFCFPTFFESEAFSVVILEAMQFALPVVATAWRGIPSIIEDGVSGLLVPIRDSAAVAEKLETLIRNPVLARAMGMKGREIFLSRYLLEQYRDGMARVFEMVGGDHNAS